ncbi:NAD-dependent glycerol-3-phosphate dehydrogenase [Leptospira fainei serovar Hurstbridge str. BUT 6]|uniref:NAD-dependent glycerol-3-phosphate dehydrogenase n=1 Tax=Leptospira fainei serovar Hurstbridge str. BUT 6 TaxID=1193011 RepID=S3VYB7_9LEPT|nr:1-acyl-sn-glycerol-3-phosphate acyltransferase [Leptospira fainei]EPG73122.1 NAD-dependent glycerol-3-phosphate dehydrogenase [Leptospira fainei serovar Hurstbridge str. BUT 6]
MAEKEQSLGRWQKEFFENIHLFKRSGMSEEEAKKVLQKFLYLSSITPMPPAMEVFKDPNSLEQVGVYTAPEKKAREFMIEFLSPIMKFFTVEGIENLAALKPLIGKYPLTLISNHLSHLDAPAIFHLLYHASPEGRSVAEQLVFIAGRLAYEPDFTRLGLYMFGTLLVCSKRDMADNPSLSDLMTKINMRAFRNSQKLQNEGKIVAIFPEGTRSRDGRLMPFVDTVYHYVANKVVLPISLEKTDKILPTTSLLFNQVAGKLVIGKPVLVGDLSRKQMESFPKNIEHLPFPEHGDKKQFLIDNLALLVGQNLNKHQHGIYRNLYSADSRDQNKLIKIPKEPREKVVVIGNSSMGIAIATIIANKDVLVQVYHPDTAYTSQSNEERRDLKNYSLYKLPPNLTFTSDPEALKDATLFIQGTNPWEIHTVYPELQLYLTKNKAPFFNVVKGFTSSGLILDDLQQALGIEDDRIGVISGASYPDQIMERKISGFEIAAANETLIPRVQKLLTTGYIFPRPAIVPTDYKGVQLGGALKTIYALVMGIVEGYFNQTLGGNVDNSLFHLSNRFFNEMVKVGVQMGGQPETFQGLAGLTDFMLSCFGTDAKDRKTGYDIANGHPSEKMSNGFYGLKVMPNLMKIDPEEVPIMYAAYEVVINKKDARKVAEMMEEKLSRV